MGAGLGTSGLLGGGSYPPPPATCAVFLGGGVGLTPQKLREVKKGWRGGLWATLAVNFLCDFMYYAVKVTFSY